MSNSDKKYQFYRKPVVRTAPEIKHTKTSLKRIYKANPLLEDTCEFNSSIVGNKSKIHTLKRSQSLRNPSVAIVKNPTYKDSLIFKKPKTERKIDISRRRSLSAGNIERKLDTVADCKNLGSTITQSERDLLHPENRQSSSRRSIYRTSTPLPSLDDLEKRLHAWLLKRGKRVAPFKKLTFFVHDIEDNKENLETRYELKGSYEDLRIIHGEDERNANIDISSIAKEALTNLIKLVQEGYPLTCCEQWLSLIKEKNEKLSQEPEYWECRAAIEESRGNFGGAVDCYREAIVTGAEVNEVDKSLNALLKKFSVLDISPKLANGKPNRERAKIIEDAKNVFKSSIIKFAVASKKNTDRDHQLKLVATPVRRSTRMSRKKYFTSPGINLMSSLKELESPERKVLEFHENKVLL